MDKAPSPGAFLKNNTFVTQTNMFG